MNIGIDIDDTITNSSEVVKEYCYKYDSAYCTDNRLIKSFERIIRGFLDDDVVKRFFNDHARNIGNDIKIKENAKEVIDKLRSKGNKIFIITARSDKFYENAQKFCEEYLKRNNINYDKLITGQTFKIETCKNEKIDLMIDDAIDTCEELAREGIKTILFNSEININKETSVKRVDNWNQLYNEIQNL